MAARQPQPLPLCLCEQHAASSGSIVHLKKLIEDDGISFNHLCFILQATGAVISGSSILRCLNGDTKGYMLSDIDIYVEKHNAALLNTFLYPIFDYSKISLKNNQGKISYHQQENPSGGMFNKTNPPEGYPEVLPHIVGLYNYSCRKKVLHYTFEAMSYIRPYQVIVLEDGVKPQEFVKNFDLTFCQNYFDGEKIVSYHPECVSTKKGYITIPIDEKRVERMRKYEYRGYTVLNKQAAEAGRAV